MVSKTTQKDGTEVHHEESRMRGTQDHRFCNIHKIIQPNMVGRHEN